MSKPWFNEKGITANTLEDLMEAALNPQFGETGRETLSTFLMCQAFECRMAPEIARAFHLAAMIISRVPKDGHK
jgi:hypothetical protein